MSETQDVGNQTGAAGSTNPNVSPNTPIESKPDTSQELLNRIQKELELTRSELKGLQSRQDKETNEVQRFMGEVKKRMASGMSLEQAEKSITAEMEVAKKDELLYKIAEKVGVLGSSSNTPAGNGQTLTINRASELEKYGLDENDPDVASALTGNFTSPEAFENAILKVAIKKANKPTPDAAVSIAAQGTPTRSQSVDALTTEYQKEMIAARGNKTAIIGIREKYKKMGVPVESVVFH